MCARGGEDQWPHLRDRSAGVPFPPLPTVLPGLADTDGVLPIRTPGTKPSTHRIKGWDRACREDLVQVVVDGAGLELHGRRDELVTRTRAHRRTGMPRAALEGQHHERDKRRVGRGSTQLGCV